jgi:Polysaccharide deacetylase
MEVILHPRQVAWIGVLAFGAAACSGDEGSEFSGPPPFIGAGGVGGGAPAEPVAGSSGQTGGVPATGSGGSTNEAGIPVTGGIAGSAGSGGSGAAAAGAGGGAALPGAADAGPLLPDDTLPPEDTTPDDTVVDGPVGPGPSSLPPPPGAANVPRPAGVAGDITVLNWAGFTGAVTYSFDDNNPSQIQNYDTLNALDVPFTFYLWTGQQSASNAVWGRALADGHEIGNHTLSHNPNICTPADINSASQFVQNNLGTKAWTMAAPNGNICYKTAATGLFFINRGVSPAQPVLPNDNSDPLNLNCYIPAPGQQTGTYNNNVNDARMRGGWVIYAIHGFTGDPNAFQPGDVNQLTGAIQYTKSLGDMWIGAMVDVGAYWLGQRAFSRAMTSQTGNARTWSWTLPGQFPTGKYIRARVDGGTPTQNGQPLTWDPHGYYEIALDAGSVTLTP